MLNRLSLNNKKPDNTHLHQNSLYNEKQNNQKNLNRTKRSQKINPLEQCLLIKPVDNKNYLTNADTSKINSQSNYNSTQNVIDLKPRAISRTLPKFKLESMIKNQKQTSNSKQFCELYGHAILKQHEVKPISKSDFLEGHQINSTLRAKMLDWMSEVMGSYKFINKSYFAGVQLMDRYLTETHQSVPLSQLHILGVTSMYIATKMEQVYPLKIKTVYQKIVHKKISKDTLMQMEAKVFQALDHKVNSWTFFDLALLKVYDQVDIQDNLTKEKLQDVISFISKCILHDYKLYIKYDMESLAQVVSYIGAKICGLQFENEVSFECDEQVTNSYKSFKNNFKGLTNIFKFTNQSTINLVDSYFFETKMF